MRAIWPSAEDRTRRSTTVTFIQKAAAVNPLKSSQPLGAALAFLGVDGAMQLFHGSQGCTSFALVLFVRHFKETIPLQTTAMDEVATVLGGADNLEEALINLKIKQAEADRHLHHRIGRDPRRGQKRKTPQSRTGCCGRVTRTP